MTNYDLVIRGGTVIDGTGAAAYTADVAVAGDCSVGEATVSWMQGAHWSHQVLWISTHITMAWRPGRIA